MTLEPKKFTLGMKGRLEGCKGTIIENLSRAKRNSVITICGRERVAEKKQGKIVTE